MKKIFALAMAMVSMVAVMTSCNNDDTDFIEQKAPVQTQVKEEVKTSFDGKIYFAAYDEQLEYINDDYNVTVGNETIQVNVKDMQKTNFTPASMIEAFTSQEMLSASFVRPTIYVYQVPAGMKGEVKVACNLSIKEGVELPENVKCAIGGATNGRNNVRIMSLPQTKLQGYFDTMNNATPSKL